MADSSITGQIADAVTWRKNERELYAQYVIAERQKWRDRIRELVIKTVKIAAQTGNLLPNEVQKLHEIRAEFRIRLNLNDSNDWYITEFLFRKIIEHRYNDIERLRNLSLLEIEVSWLLKEDWERVKYDTRPLWEWRVPKAKVDRSYKTITRSSYIRLHKEYSTILTVVFFVFLLCLITGAVGWAYQFVQPKEAEKEKYLQQLPKPTSVIPMTFSPLIINTISENTDEAKAKKSINHQKSREQNSILECTPYENAEDEPSS